MCCSSKSGAECSLGCNYLGMYGFPSQDLFGKSPATAGLWTGPSDPFVGGTSGDEKDSGAPRVMTRRCMSSLMGAEEALK